MLISVHVIEVEYKYMIESKLPKVGTTIFATMSQLAAEHNAINLSQGFPDFPVSEELIDLIYRNMQMGHNQYAPMAGLPKLREAIAHKIDKLYNLSVSAETDITVTAGATEAIFSSIMALVHKGDEVIVLEPAYDCYIPAIELAGGKPVPVLLNTTDFSVDWEAVERAVNGNTRVLMINTPHNPTGAVLSHTDLERLKKLLERNPKLTVISDEVYEHIIFDEVPHYGMLNDPFLASRSVAIYSFGKTFHATGWKLGYAVAPEALSKEIRKVHQYVTFSVHTPSQFALASYLENEEHYKGLHTFYQKKRNAFKDKLKDSRFRIVPCYGTYFQLLDYSAISDQSDKEFANYLTKELGVAGIPISVFYSNGFDPKMLRFCFAKGEDTLTKAAEILCKI